MNQIHGLLEFSSGGRAAITHENQPGSVYKGLKDIQGKRPLNSMNGPKEHPVL